MTCKGDIRSQWKMGAMILSLFLLASAVPAVAHHSFCAGNPTASEQTLTGTVTKIEWQNPHTWFFIDVKEETTSGRNQKTEKITNWGVEVGPPHLLATRTPPIKRDTIKVGDQVTVIGKPARDRPVISSCEGGATILSIVPAASKSNAKP